MKILLRDGLYRFRQLSNVFQQQNKLDKKITTYLFIKEVISFFYLFLKNFRLLGRLKKKFYIQDMKLPFPMLQDFVLNKKVQKLEKNFQKKNPCCVEKLEDIPDR